MPTPSFPLPLSLPRSALLAATLLCLPGVAPWAQTAPALVGAGAQAVTGADVLAETMPIAVYRHAADWLVRIEPQR